MNIEKHKLSADEEQTLIKEYADGRDGATVLGRKYGISATTVLKIIKSAGVEPRLKRLPRISEERMHQLIREQQAIVDEITATHASGDYVRMAEAINKYRNRNELARDLGISLITLNRTMGVYGIVVYPSIHHLILSKMSMLALTATANEADLL